MWINDTLEATYTINYYLPGGEVLEYKLVGVFGFDKEKIRQQVLHTGYSYLDNSLYEAVFRPLYPAKEARWWEDTDEGID